VICKQNKIGKHLAARRFRRNVTGFWDSCRWFILIFVIAQLCDTLSTIIFMSRGGWYLEAHPIIREFARIFGVTWDSLLGFAYKVSLGITVAIYLRKFAPLIFLSTATTAALAAIYNVLATPNTINSAGLLASLGFY